MGGSWTKGSLALLCAIRNTRFTAMGYKDAEMKSVDQKIRYINRCICLEGIPLENKYRRALSANEIETGQATIETKVRRKLSTEEEINNFVIPIPGEPGRELDYAEMASGNVTIPCRRVRQLTPFELSEKQLLVSTPLDATAIQGKRDELTELQA